jgi:hypothetical protein
VKIFKPLDPISEASFASSSSRAPASVSGEESETTNSRAPAAVPHATKKQAIRVTRSAKAYQEVSIIASETGFYPATVFLTEGIPARIYITGASAKSQCFMLDQFGVRRQIRNQKIEEITFVPDQAGTFTYNCPMNGAKGNLIVKDLEVGGRLPASTSDASVSEVSAGSISAISSPESRPQAHAKKSYISDDDFTPEFR